MQGLLFRLNPHRRYGGCRRSNWAGIADSMFDFDKNVMSMEYGELEAVKQLCPAEIIVNHAQSMLQALIIFDDEGYSFTPTPIVGGHARRQSFWRAT